MARPLGKLEEEIRTLSSADKEAQRRDLELDDEKVRSVGADEVFQRLEATLKK